VSERLNLPPLMVFLNLQERIKIIFDDSAHTLHDMFVHGLKTIYYAKRQIAETLPKMIGMATNRTDVRCTDGRAL